MEAIKFKGQTRVLGESQGYKGLPIKDCMNINEDNQYPIMISVWKPSEEELMQLMYGGYIMLTVVGTQHPAVSLDVLKDE